MTTAKINKTKHTPKPCTESDFLFLMVMELGMGLVTLHKGKGLLSNSCCSCQALQPVFTIPVLVPGQLWQEFPPG